MKTLSNPRGEPSRAQPVTATPSSGHARHAAQPLPRATPRFEPPELDDLGPVDWLDSAFTLQDGLRVDELDAMDTWWEAKDLAHGRRIPGASGASGISGSSGD